VGYTILESFIVLEGLDGAGTTTQAEELSRRLSALGRPYWVTWEPSDGHVGAMIRSVLSHKAPALPRTIALLFSADRNEHLEAAGGIRERTARGELVISDRYLFSSLAYQSIDCGMEYVRELNKEFPLPQCLFFVDTPVEICQRRLAQRSSRELFDNVSFQSRVREAYLAVIEGYKGSGMRICILDGSRSARRIGDEIWKVLESLPIHKV
jgi:dTMP kinase